jgi:hypothetical protein
MWARNQTAIRLVLLVVLIGFLMAGLVAYHQYGDVQAFVRIICISCLGLSG